MSEKKLYIQAEEFLLDSFRLGKQILESDFRPDFIVGIWRGGTPVGIAVQEYLAYHGVITDHIAIRTSRYDNTEIDKESDSIRVHGEGYIVDKANSHNKLLLIDDVFDRGHSGEGVLHTLEKKMRKNFPETKIATIYYKPNRNQTNIKPDFYIHETDDWLIFPHELMGLSYDEIKEKNPEVIKLLTKL
ncbi:hypoxanthine phosphoribosyltransferase [Candidatus Woesearchaeota archaeon]|nr:hypoxanthine phosphoribosyltransferase [Candidatus Woesearchaeota archaeon]